MLCTRLLAVPLLALTLTSAAPFSRYDVVIRGGQVYDGSGVKPVGADVAITGDRIVAVGPHLPGIGRIEVDARGKAVTPGFINMLAHPEESLFADGRALSDLAQGVTLEVIGEISMGPLSPAMQRLMSKRQGDIRYPVTWTTLGGYLDTVQHRGIGPNIASFVSASTVRENLLGEADVQPTPAQLVAMQGLVRQAMEEGALGLTDALIYAPATYAKTPELIALAKVSAACGGIYTVHMRSEADRLEQGIQETIDIARASGAPAEIYHWKQAGRDNWGKFDRAVDMVEGARASGVRITADMYVYTAGATGLDAAMPPWVQNGGLEAWITRLRDPATRAKVKTDMQIAHPSDWENFFAGAGPEGMVLLQFKNPRLKPLTGKTLAQVARERGVSPEDAAMDLVSEDGSRVGTAYFLMTEANVQRSVKLPWMSFGSDAGAPSPEGVFLAQKGHPRAYGNFARVLGHYVRENKDLSLSEAVRRFTSLPADTLSLANRGRLKVGNYADIVVFDASSVIDKATYENPNQLATGVTDVIVNGRFAIKNGRPTGVATGRVIRGRAWNGAAGGNCRASAKSWPWPK